MTQKLIDEILSRTPPKTVKLLDNITVEPKLRGGYVVINHFSEGHERGVSTVFWNKKESKKIVAFLKKIHNL